jgi:L-lactate dehydrogenase complex protein LldG
MPLSSRKKIFSNLKKEYRGRKTYTSPVFNYLVKPGENIEKSFEEKLVGLKGRFVHCNSIIDFHDKFIDLISQYKQNEIVCFEENIHAILPHNLAVATLFSETCNIYVTGCEFLVAQTGSVVVTTAQTGSRKTIAYPTTHIIIAKKDQLVEELPVALNMLSVKYKNNFPSQLTVITGPSRTADIEKTLVMGAHGPKELIIFYLDQ